MTGTSSRTLHLARSAGSQLIIYNGFSRNLLSARNGRDDDRTANVSMQLSGARDRKDTKAVWTASALCQRGIHMLVSRSRCIHVIEDRDGTEAWRVAVHHALVVALFGLRGRMHRSSLLAHLTSLAALLLARGHFVRLFFLE